MAVRSFGGTGNEFEKLLKVIFMRLKVYMRGIENEKRGFIIMGEKVIIALRQFLEVLPLHCVFVSATTFVEAFHERIGMCMQIYY